MNKSFKLLLITALAISAAACAKTESEDTTEAAIRAFNAKMEILYKDLIIDETTNGICILEDIPGTGEVVTDSSYVFVNFLVKGLNEGTIGRYTCDSIAYQLGEFSESSYYGPQWIYATYGGDYVGLVEMMITGGPETGPMKVGGKRTAVIPSWLTGTVQYASIAEYISNVSGNDNYIVELEVVELEKDILERQKRDMAAYAKAHKLDTVQYNSGNVVYARTREPLTEEKLPTDTVIYINYTGRLLNGKVFDTTIEDTAKVHGIYVKGSTYSPVSVTANSDSTAFTMSSSSLIKGFSITLSKMHPYEAGVGLFTSDFGYGNSGSGTSIPGYFPLVFEIELVDNPDE